MNYEIELRHLRYFVAVAEELHFGRAAQRLHLAQPPLSQQIRKLEAIIGHALFTRTSRAVKLTAAGEVLLDRARRTLSNVREDLEEARSLGRGESGFLKVGFIGSSMLTALPSMLGEYRRKYPSVQLQLHEAHTAMVMQSIMRSDWDVGILRDGGPCQGLEVRTLFSEPFLAVVPASHPLAAYKEISAAKLRDEPFVFFPAGAGTRAFEKPVSICEQHGFRPRIVQEAPQWLTLLRLVGAGFGVTIAPSCVRQVADPDTVCLRLRGSHVRSDIELAYRSGDGRPIVKAFTAIATTMLQKSSK
jgi:DNA-binding transcriptional LysR family regulator